MFTSADKKYRLVSQARRTVLAYLGAAGLCILFDKVYALYGHEVGSPSMTLMFLYPLLGGALPFLILWVSAPPSTDRRGFRTAYNLYNSGIALLTVRSMLVGVFEIAGTSSDAMIFFLLCAVLFLAAGAAAFIMQIRKEGKSHAAENI